ncbi:MAG: plasmid replication initiator TrfA [Betaproteobacteria bacterium]|nr:plasmid replication initiator TrfA [Betaproteobacteria bacterium]MCL2885599.1 plasmid replication initiator TrfA [Betaproteobacteria bacterium]
MEAATLGAAKPRQALVATDPLAGIRQRNIERALADAQLPLWPEPMRGVPNGVLRSALFGAIKRGKRRYMEREPIACVKGISIIYTGPRLDQSDLDVWEGALHLARLVKLGNRIEFTEKAFLRLIGRGGPGGSNIGKSDREWLRKVLARLTATAVEVTQGPYTYGGSLIDEYFRDGISSRYAVILNPRMKAIFNRDSWTQVDWSVRHALIGHPLAQWLHGFYSTHAEPIPYKVETLHLLCGSEAGENARNDAERRKALLDWTDDSLIPAFEALERESNKAGQSFSGEVGGDGLVRVSRLPSASQQRHLRGRAGGRIMRQRT